MYASLKQKSHFSTVSTFAAALVLGAGLIGSTAYASEDAKWFVVRHHTTGNCWTGMLVRVNGEYAHAFAQIAGGPFDTKKEALEREVALEQKGVCTK
ncbi:MAG: hypothetical protein AB7U75_10540 [Hyphomicrobiaceae bacterium]